LIDSKLIRNIDLFSSLDNQKIDFLKSISNISEYIKNSILYYELESSNQLIFLITGLVKVYKIDKFDNEIFLYHINPNSMISELSSLKHDNIKCFANAEFVEHSTILSIDFIKFKEKFLPQNNITFGFINELMKKNRQLHTIVNRELVFDATAKVASMLSSDLDIFNSIKRSEVALLLNIQPETLSRVLKRFIRNSVIKIEKGQVSIKNIDELNSIFEGIGK